MVFKQSSRGSGGVGASARGVELAPIQFNTHRELQGFVLNIRMSENRYREPVLQKISP